MKPELTVVMVTFERNILAGSVGVENGDTLGNSYNSSDVSYSRGGDWDDDDDY